MKGTIAIPSAERAERVRFPEFDARLMLMRRSLRTVTNREFGPDTSANRNALVRRALDRGSDFILFLDDDMLVEEDLLARLLAHDLPVVGGLCLRRCPPFDPLAVVRGDEPLVTLELADHGPEDVVPVRGVGTGGMLIRRDVLDAIPEPWFQMGHTYAHPELIDAYEDYVFCHKATEAGFSVHVDLGARLGHLVDIDGPVDLRAVVWPIYDAQGWGYRVDAEAERVRGMVQPDLAVRFTQDADPSEHATITLARR